MLCKILVVLFGISVVAFADSSGPEPVVITDQYNPEIDFINKYIDNVILPFLTEYIENNNVEPIKIPDYQKIFNVGVLCGWIKLSNGKLHGLSSIIRTADVKIKDESPILREQIPLSVEELQFTYDLNGKFAGIDIEGQLIGNSLKNLFTVEIELNMLTQKVSLKGFPCNTPGQITIQLLDDQTPNWVLDVFSKIVTPHLKPLARGMLNGILIEFVKTAVQLYNDSVQAQELVN